MYQKAIIVIDHGCDTDINDALFIVVKGMQELTPNVIVKERSPII